MTMSDFVNLERQYLQAILNYLDVCLELEVHRWQLAGQNSNDRFRGLYTTDSDALALTRRGFESSWGTGITLPEADEKSWTKSKSAAQNAISTIENEALKQGLILRLQHIKEVFNLSQFEFWALIICLAPEIDLRYERIYGYLQDDVTRVTASTNLILNLLRPADVTRYDLIPYFDSTSALRKNRLILPVEETPKQLSTLRQSFRVGLGVVNWLFGHYEPSISIGINSELIPFAPDPTSNSIYDIDGIPNKELIQSIKPILAFHGEDHLQRELIARQLACTLEKPFLLISFEESDEKELANERLLLGLRDAKLINALLYVRGIDLFVDSEGNLNRPATSTLMLMEETLVLSGKNPFKFDPDISNNPLTLFQVPVASLISKERLELWDSLLDGVPQEFSAEDLDILSSQFNLTSAQIIAASSTALATAVQNGRPVQSKDLFDAARVHSGHHLAELAHKIEPRYQWDDLVLPETPITMLKEMVSMVQTRGLVLETWGLGKKLASGNGISALFSGPPGTGKTLAAQIMANQLGIDLYRIDLSTIISKYVGETEKNLERIFREASESNAILFFDEADTIFGKRSEVKDAQDRYANIEVGYLLQRMESYNGVAILATNLRANLDEAFTRRLNFIINFPFPDEEYRHRIWEVLIPPDLPIADDLDLKKMAMRFKLAGGNIRNIVVSAAYLAAANGRRVTMDHLLHGAKREIQKMGKLIHESDFNL